MRGGAVLAMSCLLASCSGGTAVVPLLYDTCFSLEDCVEGATLCEELVVEFSGLEYVNAICTTECAVEGATSPDCSRALIGRFGSCYPSSIAGGIDETLICLEPCDTDADCLLGFRCLGAIDLCGANAFDCPIDPGDAICVPGPY
ncbi:MAG: hypothetical protein JRE81_01740 [Deltaproteobacteria bacterium]|jgi:hypothetical protein|nr:hypothetical protein [Deltaproteobacteria bacterium]